MPSNELIRLGNMYGADKGSGYAGNVYAPNGICPTINTCGGGNREPMCIEIKARKLIPNVIIGGMQEHQSIKTDGICTTLTSSMGTGGGYVPMVVEVANDKPALVFKGGCDLTTDRPELMNIQSCMAARYDAGVVRHRKEHTGVIEVYESCED